MPPPPEIKFGQVSEPWWDDRPVLVVGCGASLKGFAFERLQGLGYVLAVKQAVWDLPFADACFGLDLPWMKRCQRELSNLTIPLYLSVPTDVAEQHYTYIPNAVYLQRLRKCEQFTTNPAQIECGGNSGFGAVNFAWLKRAKLIYLFGFDYSPRGGHYCPDRYDQPVGHNARYWTNWGSNFLHTVGQLKSAGVRVINASPDSTVAAYPKVTIEQALRDLACFAH